jgi:uncharacterized membrane protein
MKNWELAFTGKWPAAIVFLLAIGAGLLAYLLYRTKRENLPPRILILLTTLRIMAIAIVAIFLLKPVIRYSRTKTEDTEVLVLLDVSKSMSITDASEGQSRLDAGVQVLTKEPYLLIERISKKQPVRLFTFGSFTTETTADAVFKAEHEATALGEALKDTVSRLGSQSLSAIVLLSDGVNTTGEDPRKVAKYIEVPVHVVALGGKVSDKTQFYDIGIAGTGQNLEFIVNNKAKITARLSNYGLQNFTESERKLPLLLKEGEDTLATTEVQFPRENGTIVADMEYVPKKLGIHKLSLLLPSLPGEAVKENNSRIFTVRVIDPKIRTLVVEGTVRTEYRFLRRVLESDPNVDLTGVVKLRKDRFYIQGVDPGIDLSRGLPVRNEDFKKFDVIILGDIARDEFTHGQIQGLKEFVEDGGGLLVMGGYNAYGDGGWGASALADVLPVTIGAVTGQADGKFAPRLTRAGKDHPVFEGCAEFFGEGQQQVTLDGANKVAGAKFGSVVLLVHPTEKAGDEPLPIVAVHRYGGGNVLAFTADTTWKWKFQIESKGLDSPFYRFWRQAIRWLVGGRKGEGFEGEALLSAWPNKPEYEHGENVLIEAKVRDRAKEPHDKATVELQLHYPSPVQKVNPRGEKYTETSLQVQLQHIPLSMGQYQTTLRPPVDGLYRAVVTASDAGGPLGQVEFEFIVGRATTEFDRVDIDEPVLRIIAGETGGEYHTLATAAKIPDEIEASRRKIIEHQEMSLWNAPAFFLIFLACAAAEWFLRKHFALS